MGDPTRATIARKFSEERVYALRRESGIVELGRRRAHRPPAPIEPQTGETSLPLDLSAVERMGSLELQARTVVDSVATGRHLSSSRGFSIEFAQYREYTPGDDLRYVDWKVFGKTDRVYLKQFDDETNFGCQILLDASESMAFQSKEAPVSKFGYARLLAACLGYVVIQQQDAVRLSTFRGGVTPGPTFAKSWPAYRQMLAEVEAERPTGASRFAHSLMEAAERLTRRSVVVVVSDGLDELPAVIEGLRQLRFRRHDVLLVQVLDAWERTFPLTQWTQFEGLEALPQLTVDARAIREVYLAEYRVFQTGLHEACLELNIDLFAVSTDMPLDHTLRAVIQRKPGLLP
ncbi:MAG: DUF58 domain-containing protein [Planctomyces sp.]|nr:DUF58 domain-containing protein [Planctomyces sp.]